MNNNLILKPIGLLNLIRSHCKIVYMKGILANHIGKTSIYNITARWFFFISVYLIQSRLIVCQLLSPTVGTQLASMINHFLSLAAPEQEWSHILINGLTIGAGDISAEDLFAVLKKRIERVLIRTVRQSHVFIRLLIIPFLSST